MRMPRPNIKGFFADNHKLRSTLTAATDALHKTWETGIADDVPQGRLGKIRLCHAQQQRSVQVETLKPEEVTHKTFLTTAA